MHKMRTMSAETASDIAVSGLQFIAGDTEQLSRFISLTGMEPEQMRAMASTPAFLEAILDYFMGHEPTLLSFAASAGIDPQDVVNAKAALAPHPDTGA